MNAPLDTDIVTFGKFKGKTWQDIDVKYLHWMFFNTDREDVKAYVKENLDALKMENSDVIWH